MIWIFFILLIGLTLGYLWPVLSRPAPITARATLERELAASKSQLAQIDEEIASGFQDEESAARARRAMQRRVLKLADRLDATKDGQSSALAPLFRFGAPAVILIGSILLYLVIGSPGFSKPDDTVARFAGQLENELGADSKDDIGGNLLLARAYRALGETDKAGKHYALALEAAENKDLIQAELQVLARDKAIRSTKPDDPMQYVDLAERKWGVGDIDGAEQAYRTALQVGGENEDVSSRLDVIDLERRLGKATTPDPDGYLQLARAKVDMGNLSGAYRDYQVALQASGNNQYIAYEFDTLRMELDLLESDAVTPMDLVQLGRRKTNIGLYDGAIDLYEAALRMSNGHRGIDAELQVLRLEKRLTEMDAPDPEGYALLGRAKESLGNIDGAIRAYRIALEASGGDSEIAAELQRLISLREQRTSEAPELNSARAEAIRNMSPEEQEAQIAMMIQGLADRLEDDPENLDGWLRLIRARTVTEDFDQAREDLQAARTVFAAEPEALSALDALAEDLNRASTD